MVSRLGINYSLSSYLQIVVINSPKYFGRRMLNSKENLQTSFLCKYRITALSKNGGYIYIYKNDMNKIESEALKCLGSPPTLGPDPAQLQCLQQFCLHYPRQEHLLLLSPVPKSNYLQGRPSQNSVSVHCNERPRGSRR